MAEPIYRNEARTTRGEFRRDALSQYRFVVTCLDDQDRGVCFGWADTYTLAAAKLDQALREGRRGAFIEPVTSCRALPNPKPKTAAGITYFNP